MIAPRRAVCEVVAEAAAGSGWIIEGVWAELLEVALVRATVLVWLDLSWDECLRGFFSAGRTTGTIRRTAPT